MSQVVRQAELVQTALVRRVMPVLHSLLVTKTGAGGTGSLPAARAPVALAIAKLVSPLPCAQAPSLRTLRTGCPLNGYDPPEAPSPKP